MLMLPRSLTELLERLRTVSRLVLTRAAALALRAGDTAACDVLLGELERRFEDDGYAHRALHNVEGQ